MKYQAASILWIFKLCYTFGFQINYWKNIGSFCADHHYNYIAIYNNFNDSVYITAHKYAQIKLMLFDLSVTNFFKCSWYMNSKELGLLGKVADVIFLPTDYRH